MDPLMWKPLFFKHIKLSLKELWHSLTPVLKMEIDWYTFNHKYLFPHSHNFFLKFFQIAELTNSMRLIPVDLEIILGKTYAFANILRNKNQR